MTALSYGGGRGGDRRSGAVGLWSCVWRGDGGDRVEGFFFGVWEDSEAVPYFFPTREDCGERVYCVGLFVHIVVRRRCR